MAALDSTDTTPAEPVDQTETPIYMPGTPTLSFTAALARLASKLSR